jgi:NADPH-dependent glutamate synthase beta subunit-like oxidoreductase
VNTKIWNGLELSARAVNVLTAHNIMRFDDVLREGRYGLMRLPNLGARTVTEIMDAVLATTGAVESDALQREYNEARAAYLTAFKRLERAKRALAHAADDVWIKNTDFPSIEDLASRLNDFASGAGA